MLSKKFPRANRRKTTKIPKCGSRGYDPFLAPFYKTTNKQSKYDYVNIPPFLPKIELKKAAKPTKNSIFGKLKKVERDYS